MANDQSNKIPVACFAPPLTDELLARYEALIADLKDPQQAELHDAMQTCLACVKAWWELPESTKKGKKWAIKNGATGEDLEYREVPLEEAHVKQLWDVTPYMRELQALEPLFDALPLSPPELRNAAFHLLWHAKEITLDREPLTQDKLHAAAD